MNERYPAVYTDDYGQEQVILQLEPDEEHLSLTLRGVHFHGISFDTFYVWPVDQNPELLQRVHLCEALVGAGNEQGYQMLECFQLQWTMPFSIAKQGQTVEGTLRGTVEHRKSDDNDRYGATHWDLILQIDGRSFEARGDELDMEEALNQLLQQFPPDSYLKCCLFCLFSDFETLGGCGILCFRSKKEQFRLAKYQPVPKGKHPKFGRPAHKLRDKQIHYVQEAYLCPAFEVDPVTVEYVRRRKA